MSVAVGSDVAEQTLGPAQPSAVVEPILDRILRCLGECSDFPALSASLMRIQRAVNSDSASLATLSEEILTDVALTSKLLRVVNSAAYAEDSSLGVGTVSTVSRAVALVGHTGIRNMAMSLVLLDRMQNKGHAKQLQTEFVRAMMAGMLAEELSCVERDAEEAFIGAMFLGLGRLLTQYYLPGEAQAIRESLVDEAPGSGGFDAAAEVRVSRRVLGLSYEELGLGVAGSWGLPPSLLACMQRSGAGPPQRFAQASEHRVRWITHAAGDMADAMLDPDPRAASDRIAGVAKRYRHALGRDMEDFKLAVGAARRRMTEMSKAMGLQFDADSPGRRMLIEDGGAAEGDKSLTTLEPADAARAVPAVQAVRGTEACDKMTEGIQAITNSMVDSFDLDVVLREILQVMQRAFEFRRVLLCLRDVSGESLRGRLGVGAQARPIGAAFTVDLKGGSDLFSVVCRKGVDTLISDATLSNIAQRLPAWYRSSLNAPAFLLMPMQLKSKPLGLIYADKAQAGAIDLSEKELALLRTLRNQAVMAFRQST